MNNFAQWITVGFILLFAILFVVRKTRIRQNRNKKDKTSCGCDCCDLSDCCGKSPLEQDKKKLK